jgi:hypothetical protein
MAIGRQGSRADEEFLMLRDEALFGRADAFEDFAHNLICLVASSSSVGEDGCCFLEIACSGRMVVQDAIYGFERT